MMHLVHCLREEEDFRVSLFASDAAAGVFENNVEPFSRFDASPPYRANPSPDQITRLREGANRLVAQG